MGRTQLSSRDLLIILLGAVLTAGCGNSPTNPSNPPPTVDPPKLTCPAAQTAQSSDGQPVAVTFSAPILVGGFSPVTVACTPPNGAKFAVGSSSVACTATDLLQRTDSCTFAVTVQFTPPPAPKLSATRFLEFGDSMTEGKLGTATLVIGGPFQFANSYPEVLDGLLTARYPAQAQAILNVDDGLGGEKVADGMARLPGELAKYAPQVVLLLEGANDLNELAQNQSATTPVVDGLMSMVRRARTSGDVVFIGTILPMRAGGKNAAGVALVAGTNDQIRARAAGEGAVLVDLWQAFGGQPGSLIGPDGLHPTSDGYKLMAQTFFDAIRARLEVTSTTTSAAGHR